MLEPSPLVSVIIPLHNGESSIADALRSVFAQTYGVVEAIVVDDGSTDRGGEIVRSLGDARVVYMRQPNRGIAAARNAGIRRSRGELIAFLDQDDLFLPHKLAVETAALLADADTGVVYSEVSAIDEAGRPVNTGRSVFHARPSGDVLLASLARNIVPGTAGILVRRSCFDAAGLFDEGLSGVDDWEMWTRLAAITKFRYVPIVTGCVRFHQDNTSNDLGRMRRDGEVAIERSFAHPLVVAALPEHALRNLKKKASASLCAYCGTRQLLTAAPRAAIHDLARAVALRPLSIREWVLLGFAVIGYVPRWLKRRIL